jgi:Uncharacterized protein, possibly involved in aromatic compounds catabolism
MIWFKKDLSPADLAPLSKNTMGETLGIVITEVGPDYLRGTMPVDNRTKQPYGLLHGGASCVLAETLGSIASACVVDTSKFFVLVSKSMLIICAPYDRVWLPVPPGRCTWVAARMCGR